MNFILEIPEIMEDAFQPKWSNVEKIKEHLYERDKELFPLLKFIIKSDWFELMNPLTDEQKRILRAFRINIFV